MPVQCPKRARLSADKGFVTRIELDGAFRIGARALHVSALTQQKAAMVMNARSARRIAHGLVEIGERPIELAAAPPGQSAVQIGQ